MYRREPFPTVVCLSIAIYFGSIGIDPLEKELSFSPFKVTGPPLLDPSLPASIEGPALTTIFPPKELAPFEEGPTIVFTPHD